MHTRNAGFSYECKEVTTGVVTVSKDTRGRADAAFVKKGKFIVCILKLKGYNVSYQLALSIARLKVDINDALGEVKGLKKLN